MLALTLLLGLSPTANPKPTNPRQVAEAYLAAALADKPEEAAKFAEEGKSPSRPKSVKELRGVVGAEKLALPTALFSDKKGFALAVSDEIKFAPPDNKLDRGVIVLTLKKTKDGGWLVKDIDLRKADEAAEMVKKAKKAFEDGKEIPPTKS